MKDVFLSFVNTAFTAGYLICAVLLVRILLKKAPRWISCALWIFVGLRLCLPTSIKSVLSLVPSAKTITTKGLVETYNPQIESGIPIVDETVNPILEEYLPEGFFYEVDPKVIWANILAVVWIVGVCAMLVYAGISVWRLRRKIGEAVPIEKGVYLCDRIPGPFLFGIVNPRIYLPSDLKEEDMALVTAHEKAHVKRGDFLWKPLGYLLLSLYWFHPLCWVAYILLCRDIEFACDEKVLKNREKEEIAAYSEALIGCGISRRIITVCPLAFGEVSVRQRVKSALSYKKPALWIIIAALLIGSAAVVCFFTDPIKEEEISWEVECEILEAVEIKFYQGNEDAYHTVAIDVLDFKDTGKVTTVYGKAYYAEFAEGNNRITEIRTVTAPFVAVLDTEYENRYDVTLLSFDTAQKGETFEEDVKSLFPKKLREKALSDQGYDAIGEECMKDARQYYGYDDETIDGIPYHKNEDGTYSTDDGHVYRYFRLLTREDDPFWFSVLTNKADLTFEEVFRSIYTSNSTQFLDIEETIIISLGFPATSNPPSCTVCVGDTQITAARGTYTWTTGEFAGLSSGICVDCISFGDERAQTPTVSADRNAKTFTLAFGEEEVENITVSAEDENRNVKSVTRTATGAFPLLKGKWLYVIHAEFEKGDVSYGFYGYLDA